MGQKRFVIVIISLIIILGGAFFYQTKNTNEKNKPNNSLVDLMREVGNQQGKIAKELNPIFYPTTTNLREINTEQEPQNDSGENQTSKNGENTNTEAEKEAIRDYLVASSDIGFPKDAQRTQMALQLAEQGSPEELARLRDEYEEKLPKFKELLPPDSMKEVHEKSVAVTERFIKLLDGTVHKTLGSVKETWNSEERASITKESQEIKGEILMLIYSYQINDLPPDIISY